LWRRIEVVDPLTRNIHMSGSYRLNWLRISLVNALRKFDFGHYSGLGEPFRHRYFHNFIEYFCLRHEWADQMRESWRALLIRHPVLSFVVSPIARFFQWRLYRPSFIARGLKDPQRALRRIRMLFTRISNAGAATRFDTLGSEATPVSQLDHKQSSPTTSSACGRRPRG
jgi:hypothetical protein